MGTSSDFINGDNISFTQASEFEDKNAGTGKTVTVSGITLSGTDAQNYELNSDTATTTANINQANATVTANSSTTTYNGLEQSVSGFAASGLVGNDEISDLNISGDSATGKDAGTYQTNLSSTNTNYNITFENGELKINKKQITANAIAQNKTYDGNTVATLTGISSSDIISGDTVTFSNSIAEFNDKNAGTGKTVTVNGITLNGTDAQNYELNSNQVTTTANIDKKDLTLKDISAKDKIYDGTVDATASFDLDGVVENETVEFTYKAEFEDKNAGENKQVNLIDISLNGDDAKNYNLKDGITSTTTKANIDKANATVTANSSTTTYNGLEQSVSGFTASGLVNGETEDVLTQIIGDTATGKDAGEYLTNLSGTDKNYNLTFIDGKLTIVANNTEPEIPTPPVIEPEPEPEIPIPPIVEPEPKPEPDLPSEIEKVVQDIEKITNATPIAAQNNIKDMGNTQSSVSSSSSQSSSNSEDTIGTNQNTNMMSFGNIKNVEVIDGGIKMPDGVYVSYDKDEEITK